MGRAARSVECDPVGDRAHFGCLRRRRRDAAGPVTVLIGTSGWHYNDWRGPVYPAQLPASQWLAHLAAQLPTVELNNTFYRLPDRPAFEAWAAQVPAGFVFTVKASRYTGGLWVGKFLKTVTYQRATEAGSRAVAPAVTAICEAE